MYNSSRHCATPNRLAASYSVASSNSKPSSRSRPAANKSVASSNSKPSSGSRPGAVLTEIHCPKCEWLMQKIPSLSKKLQADHFLKCSSSSCDIAMFWSDHKQGYELPYSNQQGATQKDNTAAAQRSKAPSQIEKHTGDKLASNQLLLVDFPCPVCSQPLELYEYIKSNQQRQMLRCYDASKRRADNHQNVAYFASKGVFWSPTYGEISLLSNSNKSTLSESTKSFARHSSANLLALPKTINQAVTPIASSPEVKEHPCPVCGQPLELYEYLKDGLPKQMLRCSDSVARRQDDHKNVAYFASKGFFWSRTYGEIN